MNKIIVIGFLVLFVVVQLYSYDLGELKEKFAKFAYFSGSFFAKGSDGESYEGKFFINGGRFRFDLKGGAGSTEYFVYDGNGLIRYVDGDEYATKTGPLSFYFPDSVFSFVERIFELSLSKSSKGYRLKGTKKNEAQISFIEGFDIFFTQDCFPRRLSLELSQDGKKLEISFRDLSASAFKESMLRLPFDVPVLEE